MNEFAFVVRIIEQNQRVWVFPEDLFYSDALLRGLIGVLRRIAVIVKQSHTNCSITI